MVRFLAAWLAAGALVGCAEHAVPDPTGAGLEQGVASVGAQVIPEQLVALVAVRQELPPPQALQALISDAVLAAEYKSSQPEVATYLERLALARSVSEQFVQQARRQGPPSDQELERFAAQRWWQFDRPVSSRTTHVVVLVKEGQDPAPAEAHAQRLAQLLTDAGTKEEFKRRAEAEPHEGLQIKVENLLPVVADGRVIDLANPPPAGARARRYAVTYAEAADAIPELGQTSPVVRTSFGFHVLLLTERVPGQHMSKDDQRKFLLPEIVKARVAQLEKAALDEARTQTDTIVERDALTITERVKVR